MIIFKRIFHKSIIAFTTLVLFTLTLSAQDISKNINTNFKPDFYNDVKPIELIDPLSYLLGATEKGESFVYQYSDIVKNSGHSCPSVAGAFKMTQLALDTLYERTIPQRGGIKVTMTGAPEDKVNGPIAQVISFITGAAGNTGFKGLKGKFSRYELLSFDTTKTLPNNIWAEAIFERMDNGDKIKISYILNAIPQNPEMKKVMPLIASGKAQDKDKVKFGNIWQERVKKVLINPPKEAFKINIIN